jgi:hypothetical protein
LKDVLKFYFILACTQVWLNPPVDHCNFGYNTKLAKKKKKKKKTPLYFSSSAVLRRRGNGSVIAA